MPDKPISRTPTVTKPQVAVKPPGAVKPLVVAAFNEGIKSTARSIADNLMDKPKFDRKAYQRKYMKEYMRKRRCTTS